MSGSNKSRKFITIGAMVGLILTALYFRFFMPPAISAVPSRSMVPTLQVGDLIINKPIAPSQVKVGDIIIVRLPTLVQQTFHYPDEVVHRVQQVNHSGQNFSFRTKGDNNPQEDPYTVAAGDVQGILVRRIPYAGFAVLFMHSKQGLYFLISVLVIYLVNLLWVALEKREYSIKRSVSSLFVGDLKQHIASLEKKHEESYQDIRTALHEFSHAMQEYAHHIKSHTGAVQGMASSAQELLGAVHTQNEVLAQLHQVLGGGTLQQREIKDPYKPVEPHTNVASPLPSETNMMPRTKSEKLDFDYSAEIGHLRSLKQNLGNIGSDFDTDEVQSICREQDEKRESMFAESAVMASRPKLEHLAATDEYQPRMTRKERRHLQKKSKKRRKHTTGFDT